MKKLILLFGALCASVVVFGQLKVQSDGRTIAGYESDFGSKYYFGLGKSYIIGTIQGGPNAGQPLYSIGRWFFEIGGTSSTSYFSIRRGNQAASYLTYDFYIKTNGNVGIGKVPIDNAKLDVNGAIAVNGTIVHSSDEGLKRDIRGIDDLVPKIYELEGKSYQKMLPDSTETFFEYGFLAQELQRQFPNLVITTSDGYLAVNYTALIPVIVEALKTQKQEIDGLNERIFALERMLNSDAAPSNAPARPQQETEPQETTGETLPALFQNTPNPFNENTEIAFYLPQSITNAMLCVYDMNGRQLSQNVITQRGSSVFVVNGNQYGAGMYLYSLIADNQIVDTKRMILTK